MLSQFGHVMVQVADTVMIGNMLGTVPLAAASFANGAIVNLLIFFGIGVSYAMTPLVAKADGEHNDSEIQGIFKNGMLMNLATAGLLILVILLLEQFIHQFGQPTDVVRLAVPYLNIVTASLIPLMIFQTYRQVAEGLARTKVAMLIVIGSNLLNIVLNYIFMKGLFGLTPMGLVGAAWATFISRVMMAAGMGFYIYHGSRFHAIRDGFGFGAYSRTLIKRLLGIGIPAGLQFIFEGGAFSFSLIMMGWINAKAIAAHQIAISMATLSYNMTSGFAVAAAIKCGKHLGSRNFHELRNDAYTPTGMSVGFMCLWAVIFIVGRRFLPSLYIDSLDVIAIATPLMVIAGIFQIADGAQVVCAGALRGLQDVRLPTVLILCAYWVIGLPIGYLLGFGLQMGPTGIWLGLLAGLATTAVAMYIRMGRTIGRLERSRA